MSYENPFRVSGLTAHHVAALIAVGALVFLVAVERGFRGLKIDIS
jgi:hypothetical protein